MSLKVLIIFFLVISFVGALVVSETVKSFRKRDYFIGGLGVMATFWIMLVIARTFFEVL